MRVREPMDDFYYGVFVLVIVPFIFLIGILIGTIMTQKDSNIDVENALKQGNDVRIQYLKESGGDKSKENYIKWLEDNLNKGVQK